MAGVRSALLITCLSKLHVVIVGQVKNHDVGCELSDFSDIFWNEERIGSLMRKVDAVTVATGLVHLPALAAGQLKN